MEQPQISIIIPAYNEADRIKNTLLKVRDYIENRNLNAEIIVVNDGSTDLTAFIVESEKNKIKNLSLLNYEQNRGKGYAIRKGIEAARGQYILFTDADNSTPIEQLHNLLTALQSNKGDIAIGSRYLPNSSIKIKQPLYRILIGRLGNIVIRFLLIKGIYDTQCGFKLFKHAVAKKIFQKQKITRWGFDIEALTIAKMLNYKIIEIPVSWFNSNTSRLRPIRDSFRTLRELISIKFNLLRGKYR